MFDFITIMFLLLLVSLLILLIKNAKYDLNGFELIPFWVIFVFYIYVNTGYDGLHYLPLGFLALYYLIRLIKTTKYIHWYVLLIQMLCSIGFITIFSIYENIVCEGWCSGTLIVFIILLIIFMYMLLINLVTFVIKKLKKICV